MNARQKSLARHALGLPNARRKSYRNHYCVGPPCDDYDDWQGMVAAGHAKRRADDLFRLTLSGATWALEPGERLDSIDFPIPSPPIVEGVG